MSQNIDLRIFVELQYAYLWNIDIPRWQREMMSDGNKNIVEIFKMTLFQGLQLIHKPLLI